MSCEVCIGGDGDYDDQAVEWDVKDVKARKAHKCCECRGIIAKGETYTAWKGLFSGDGWQTFCICRKCHEIADVFSCDQSRPAFGQLWEDMRDHAFPSLTTASECFRELSAESKQFVLDRWVKWKGLAA